MQEFCNILVGNLVIKGEGGADLLEYVGSERFKRTPSVVDKR